MTQLPPTLDRIKSYVYIRECGFPEGIYLAGLSWDAGGERELMKKALLTTTAMAVIFAGLIVSNSIERAFAADLAPHPPEPVPPAMMPFSWSGPYIGIHAGFGWGREHDNQSHLFPGGAGSGATVGGGGNDGGGSNGGNGSGGNDGGGTSGGNSDHFNLNGFVGGAHAGYNYQIDQFVIGAEGDLDYSDIKGSHSGAYNGGASPRTLELKSQWQGSIRVRAGYAIDNLLLYGTGGLAFADGKLTNSGSDAGIAIPTTSSSKTHIGWTVGLGAEYAFTQHWVGRAEVRYSDFNDKTYRTFDGPVKAGWDQTTGTLGVSYKF